LWEIINSYNVWQLALAISKLQNLECWIEKLCDGGMRDSPISSVEGFVEQHVKPHLLYCKDQCTEAELHAALYRLGGTLHGHVNAGHMTFGELLNQLRELRGDIDRELRFRRFAIVPLSRTQIYDDRTRAWEKIWEAFPEGKDDAIGAVDCYAIGLSTACVFHLMRVAEYGLRGLARNLHVRLPRNRRLEWAQWQDILKEMNTKADAIANERAGPRRDAKLEFYRGAIGEFYGFKDAYRNHVMHTRGSYDEFQSASALAHVQDFMKRLSARINSKGKRIRQ
jgi:hypothetical protein